MVYDCAIVSLRPSLILPDQIGVFALRRIKKNSIIFKLEDFDEDCFISWDDFKKLDKITKDRLMHTCYRDEYGFYAPYNINVLRSGCFINHSCDPNVFVDEHGNYVAKKDLKKNEELTLDFEQFIHVNKFPFNCKCGNKKCRGIIFSKSYLNIS